MSLRLREIEAESIHSFVQRCADEGLFSGRVLDLGAGRQPYRRIIEGAGGLYTPWDRITNPGALAHTDVGPDHWWRHQWDAILCTQVIQYVSWPDAFVDRLHQSTQRSKGVVVMTGPTNWPVVEHADLTRYTAEGIRCLFREAADFRSVEVRERAHVEFGGERWSLGWEAVARA